MERLIFINSNGESIELSNKKPYILQSVFGTGGIDLDVSMEKSPFQYGSTYLDTTLNTRNILLDVAIMCGDGQSVYDLRHRLLKVLNPTLGEGTLRYIYGDMTREIRCTIDSPPLFPKGRENRDEYFQKTQISLTCPSPFWLDESWDSEELSYLMGGISFPLNLGSRFSYRGKRKSLMNKGDIETPITVEFYGPASNPRITNETTGEYLKVNKELSAGEVLILDTSFGNKKVEIVDLDKKLSNAFGYIDLNSSFWQLRPGSNIISYESDDDSEKARIKITYRNRYIGV